MKRLATIGLLVAFQAGCGASSNRAGALSVEEDVFYELFTKGDATTDQATGAPSSFSTLIGYEGVVEDKDFAEAVAAPMLRAGASFFAALNQCYSGGFLNELTALGGNQSLFTSARHTETASYGYPAPEGVDVDSTDAFITALADGKVPGEMVARRTAALDPFGPNPDAARVDEPMGSEHNQYAMVGAGGSLKPADYAKSGIAVLWAGLPAERDGVQMSLMIDRLIAMGYAPERIWLLYGSGELQPSHEIAQTKIANARPINLLAATRDNLVDVFTRNFGEGRPNPDFVFFYVGDHGGLDGTSVAKPGFVPDPLLRP